MLTLNSSPQSTYSAEENSWTQERRDFCCTHFRRACKAQVREVPKWVVHDVNIPVDVPVKKEVPVPETVIKTVKASMGFRTGRAPKRWFHWSDDDL